MGGTNVNSDIRKMASKMPALLVATPGRLIDLMNQDKAAGISGAFANVKILVLDEADRLLDMGFRWGGSSWVRVQVWGVKLGQGSGGGGQVGSGFKVPVIFSVQGEGGLQGEGRAQRGSASGQLLTAGGVVVLCVLAGLS